MGRGERGQMLIVFAMLIVPVTFLIGIVAVDVSAWRSERDGAQKDADLAALAGALQLAINNGNDSGAANTAIEYARANDETGVLPKLKEVSSPGEEGVMVGTGCWDEEGDLANDTVQVNLRHGAPTFFLDAFGVDAPSIGAHAQACVGSIIGAGSAARATNSGTAGFGAIDLLPIAIDDERGCYLDGSPDYEDESETTGDDPTDTCIIQYGADPCTNRSSNSCMPHRGTDEDFRTVDLLDSDKNCSAYAGGNDFQEDGFLERQITDGVDAYCLLDDDNKCKPKQNGPWQDCVTVRAIDPHNESDGDNDQRCNVAWQRNDWCDVMAGMTARIAGEDNCGLTGTEAIAEVNGAENLFEAVECPNQPGEVSPRLATILVLDRLPADCAQNHYVGDNDDEDDDDDRDDDDDEDDEDEDDDEDDRECNGSNRGGRQGDDNDGFDVRALATVYIDSCFFRDTDPADRVERPGKWHDDCRHVKGADLVRIRVRFVRLLTQGEIGPPDESATAVGIALGE